MQVFKSSFKNKTKARLQQQVTITEAGEGDTLGWETESLHKIPGVKYPPGIQESQPDSEKRRAEIESGVETLEGGDVYISAPGDLKVTELGTSGTQYGIGEGSAESQPENAESTPSGVGIMLQDISGEPAELKAIGLGNISQESGKAEPTLSTEPMVPDGLKKSVPGNLWLKNSEMSSALDKKRIAKSAPASGIKSAKLGGGLREEESRDSNLLEDVVESSLKSAESQASDLESGMMHASIETESSVRIAEAKKSHHTSMEVLPAKSGSRKSLMEKFDQLVLAAAKQLSRTPSAVSSRADSSRRSSSISSLPIRGKFGQHGKVHFEQTTADRGKFFGITPAKFRNQSFYREIPGKESIYSKDVSNIKLDAKAIRSMFNIRSETSQTTKKSRRTGCGCCSATSRSPSPQDWESGTTHPTTNA